MSTLTIKLLGDFYIADEDESIFSLSQSRLHALLTYLLLHRHAPQARRHLAFLLWPDSSEPQALTNLRKAFTHLRQAAPTLTQFLYTDHQVVQWRPATGFTLDVAEFEAKLEQATAAEQAGHGQEAIAWWSAAVALYTGPLTPSCYDDWLLIERERLHQLCISALERLVASHEQRQELNTASHYAQQLLRLDPLQETLYLQLMRLQALQGDRAAALRTYHTCVTVLARELDVEPAPETQAAYTRLLKSKTGTGRVATTPLRTTPRLVGRAVEWAQLQRLWRVASEQRSHFVCIRGEAGIGKTHLAEELLNWAGQQGFTVAHTRAYAGEGQLAYVPVVGWLRAEALRIARSRLAPVWLSEVARLLPEILSEQTTIPTPVPMTDPWQRQRLWEALARTLLTAAQPMLLVIDDLQWCDTETLEWLRYLLHFAPHAHMLVLGTVRPEELDAGHPLHTLCRHLRGMGQLTELELGPLNLEQSALLAGQVAQQPLTDQVQERLYRATAGNPLFIVEMVRARLPEDGSEWHKEAPTLRPVSPPLVLLPPKIQAVIQSRLACLSPTAQELAQVAAVVGQDFTFELLLHASGQDEDTLARGLDELWQRRLIREQGATAYDFSHDRIRDVAYSELSPIRRRQWHRRIAEALVQIYADNPSAGYGELAYHYEHAGLFTQAADYYYQAAEAARQLYASREAIAYLTYGLKLLERLPTTSAIQRLELALQMSLGAAWVPLKDYGAPEVAQAYGRAMVLCQQIEESPQLFRTLWGLHEVYLFQADFAKARKPAEQCLIIAQRLGDATLLLQAYHALWGTYFSFGSLTTTLFYARAGLAIYHRQHHQAFAVDYGAHDTGCCAMHIAAISLALLGYPEQGRQQMAALLDLADEITQPFALAGAFLQAAIFYQAVRDISATQECTRAFFEISNKHEYVMVRDYALLLHGWAIANAGHGQADLAIMQQALTARQTRGHQRVNLIHSHVCLAESYALAGQITEGLATVAAGQALAQQCDDLFCRAELYRLQGDLLWANGETTDNVEQAYQQAIAIAQQRSEKLVELRAVTSLALLWQQQGRGTEAYQRLIEIYSWFTEGFDTADLQTAKVLLAELATTH